MDRRTGRQLHLGAPGDRSDVDGDASNPARPRGESGLHVALHSNLERHFAETVEKLLEAGIIRPSRSPWVADVVLTRKKDGSYRFNVDYRRLNDLTVGDAYEALAAMRGAGYFSVFDMASGCWQVARAE